MPEIHLSILFPLVFLLIAALCAFFISLFVYRFTVPPVAPLKRSILIALRSMGLFLLFLLIGEPLLSVVTHSVDVPLVEVLIDNSQSMTLPDQLERRDNTLKSILRSDVWKQIGSEGNLSYFLFDAVARNLKSFSEDSLTFKGEETDIANALSSVKRASGSSNVQAVVLLTDGNSTIGMNPIYEAEGLNVPVFTVGVGDTIEQKDLLVRKVLTNEVSYAGTKVPVHVTVHSAGLSGERVQVSLRNSTTVLDEKVLTLDSGTRDYLVSLSLTPEKEGMQKFTAEVSNLPGELTLQNNRLNFFMKVLKNKIRVALIAGSPGQDAAFIRRELENDKNIEVLPFFEQNDGQFFTGDLTAEVLKPVDCLVLVGFPTGHSLPGSVQTIRDAANADKPFLFFLSRTIDYGRLHALDPLLPFSVENASGSELQVFAEVPETERNNAILKMNTNMNTVELWSKLPPVFRPQGAFRAKVGSEVLATMRLQVMPLPDPFMVARNMNKKKSLAVLGYGLWRWDMLSDAGNGTDQLLGHFISNSVRWLTTLEDSRRIRVQSSKHLYTTQEPVDFMAQVYDENFEPLDDAQVEITLQQGSETSSMVLNALGNGQYQGQFGTLREGDYKFSATVKSNGTAIGSDQGSFTVGGQNAEYLETRMNKPLLQQIAAQTGGRYYEHRNVQSLAQDVATLPNFKPRQVSTSSTIEIWNARWMLALVIIAFALEWFLRKRSGML